MKENLIKVIDKKMEDLEKRLIKRIEEGLEDRSSSINKWASFGGDVVNFQKNLYIIAGIVAILILLLM